MRVGEKMSLARVCLWAVAMVLSLTAQAVQPTKLFTDSWPVAVQELGGVAYDPASDSLFFVRSTGGRTNNEVRRYRFSTGAIESVFSYVGEWEYGARVFNGELFVIGTYRDFVLRLGALSESSLTQLPGMPSTWRGMTIPRSATLPSGRGSLVLRTGQLSLRTAVQGHPICRGTGIYKHSRSTKLRCVRMARSGHEQLQVHPCDRKRYFRAPRRCHWIHGRLGIARPNGQPDSARDRIRLRAPRQGFAQQNLCGSPKSPPTNGP